MPSQVEIPCRKLGKVFSGGCTQFPDTCGGLDIDSKYDVSQV